MAEQKDKKKRFSTRVIHGGAAALPDTGAIVTPIFATSTYEQSAPGEHTGFEYARSHNPTRSAYERCIADLENGSHGFAFASGMAATSTLMDLLPAGSHVVAMDDIYGGTYRLFERIRKTTAKLETSYVDLSNVDKLREALRPNTKLIWIETPTNPLLKIVDIAAVVEASAGSGAIVCCDNTFASPYCLRPLDLGADVVMHSSTKYLNGHSDAIGGVLVTDDAELGERLRFLQNAIGGIQGPFESFLVHRGLKTLALRMERHCGNAQQLAEYLVRQPHVERVLYPGLSSHNGHDVAASQMVGFGGMVSVVVKGGLDGVRRFLSRLELFTLAESLGGVESLIEHPAIMTHASIPEARRREIGIDDGLLRISVGIEDVNDLIADIQSALSGLSSGAA